MISEAQAEAAAALHAAAFADPAAGAGPWPAREIAAFCEGPGCFALFAPEVGTPLGFLLGRAAAGEAELCTIAVSPDARRRGVARTLMQSFRAEAMSRDAAAAFLEVAENNTAARALYQAEGWSEAGRRPGYYRNSAGDRQDALLLTLTFV